MLTINFPRHDPGSRRWMPPGARPDPHRPGTAWERRAWRRVLGERFSAYRSPRLREHLAASLFASRQRSRSLGRIGLVGPSAPNSGRERDSLIGAEISLIADLNSLQGRKKFPVRMRRELAHNALI